MGLRPRFKTPFSEARDKLLGYALRPLRVFSPRTRFVIVCSSLVILTTLLLMNYSIGFSDNYREGEVLTKSIIVPADITTVDIAETERRREAAREASRPVFKFDSSRAETTVQSFRAEWEELKKHENPGPQSNLSTGISGKAFASALAAHKFNEADLNQLTTILREVGSGFIYEDADGDRLRQDIVLVDVRNPSGQIIMPAPRTRMMSLSAARRNAELRVFNLPGWSSDHKAALSSVLTSLIRPNVVLDQDATAAARETAAMLVDRGTRPSGCFYWSQHSIGPRGSLLSTELRRARCISISTKLLLWLARRFWCKQRLCKSASCSATLSLRNGAHLSTTR